MTISIRYAAGLIAAVWLTPIPAVAQVDDYQARYDDAYQRGDYAAAEAAARREIDVFKARYMAGQAAPMIPLLDLANVLQAQNKLDQALPVYIQALSLWQREKSVGISGRKVADAMLTVARIYDRQAREKDAEVMYIRALKMRESTDGTNHPRIAQLRVEIGKFYVKNGKRLDAAEAQYKSAIRILETAFADKSPGKSEEYIIEPLNALAELYEERQFSSSADAVYAARRAAIPILEQVVAIYEQRVTAKILGASVDLVEPLNKLASLYGWEVKSFATKAADVSNPRAVAEARTTQSSYFNKAEAGYTRLLAIIATGPSNDSKTSAVLKDLAALYKDGSGNFEKRADDLLIAAEATMRQRIALTLQSIAKNEGLTADDLFEALQEHAELYQSTNHKNLSPTTERAVIVGSDASYKRLIALIDQRRVSNDTSRDSSTRAYLSFASFLNKQGRTAEAENAYKTIIAMLGTPKPSREQLVPLAGLADFYMKRGQYGEAEVALLRAVDIETNEPESKNVRLFFSSDVSYSPETGMNNLLSLYETVGRSSDANALRRRIIDFRRKQFDETTAKVKPSAATFARQLETLARLSQSIGATADAEAYYRRALATIEPTKISESGQAEDAAKIISGLTDLLEGVGKFDESLRLKEQAFAMWERASPPKQEIKSSGIGWTKSIATLIRLQVQLGKYPEAEKLLNTHIAAQSRPASGTHGSFAPLLLQLLGELQQERGSTAAAEQAYRKALAFKDPKSDQLTPFREASILIRLMFLYSDTSQRQKLPQVTKRLLEISDEPFVKSIIETGQPEFALIKGLILLEIGRQADAEAVFDEVLARMEKSRGQNHPQVALTRYEIAQLFAAAGARASAIQQSRKAVAALNASTQSLMGGATGGLSTIRAATARAADAGPDSSARANAKRPNYLYELIASIDDASLIRPHATVRRDYFRQHVGNLATPGQPLDAHIAHGKEAFEAAQSAGQNDASLAIQQMAFRFADRGDKLAALVRTIQDLVNSLRERDRLLLDALARANDKVNDATVSRLRSEIKTIEERMRESAARLEKEFPDFAALANPRSISVEELQKTLRSDEGLVFILTSSEASYVFAISDNDFGWSTIAGTHDELAANVTAFRRGLDLDEYNRAIATNTTPTLFDLNLAHELYDKLLRPVSGIVGHKKNLMVVPSGPLTALPFHLLLTAPPKQSAQSSHLAAYRHVEWLLKRQAVSVLPSVASLKALRTLNVATRARKLLIGFGDPVFGNEGEDAKQRGASKVAIKTRAYTDYWKGQGIDRDVLGKALPRLADTSDELNTIAKRLGAGMTDLFLRQRATEAEVKRATLSDYRVVYFATHGLVAGDVKGLGEPSLALTIPSRPTEHDDGLLTASEVAQLKLNAEWVVLSACNTIAGDKPGAEALSGLARSFFYAGARALLVSHWAVDSAAATRLTTATFDKLQTDPKLGRAGALRAAMLDHLLDTTDPTNAYPAFWGPFVVIGEAAGSN